MSCTSGEEPSDAARTSATSKEQMAPLATGQPDFSDALPIVFSWPVATDTIDIGTFSVNVCE